MTTTEAIKEVFKNKPYFNFWFNVSQSQAYKRAYRILKSIGEIKENPDKYKKYNGNFQWEDNYVTLISQHIEIFKELIKKNDLEPFFAKELEKFK